MQAIINGEMYEVEPAVEAYVKELTANRADLMRINQQLEEELKERNQKNLDLQEEFYKQGAKIGALKAENARLEEGYQKSLGVIAATDCEECKNKVYRKAYNDVMNIRANIQEIIVNIERGADNEQKRI